MQLVAIGTQLTEAIAGLDRTTRDPERARRRLRARPHARCSAPSAATSPSRTSPSPTIPDKPVLHGISFDSTARHRHRPRRLLAAPASPPSSRSSAASTPRSSGEVLIDGIDLATIRLSSYRQPARRRPAGDLPLRRHHPREHPLLAPQRHRRAAPGSLPHRPRRRVRRALPRRLRHHRRRTRRQALRRPAPAPLHRPRHPRRPAHPHPRRGHQLTRLRVRSHDPGRPQLPDAGPHHLRHRPPPLHHPPRRPDPRRRSRAASSSAARTRRSTPLGGRYYDLYTRQHGLETNLFLAPGEGDGGLPEEVER